MFKAGDKVRCLNTGGAAFLTVGEIYTVAYRNAADNIVVSNSEGEQGSRGFFPSRFELYVKPVIKAGDEVVCINNGQIEGISAADRLTVGKVYRVLERPERTNLRVTCDNGESKGFFPSRFELYTGKAVGEVLAEVPGGSTPSQYALPESAKELQDLIEYRGMNFARGNIFKAVYRMGYKNSADERYDLNKIIFFAQRELNRLEADDAKNKSGN